MDNDDDSDLGDMLNDLLNEEAECEPKNPENSLKELNFNFLDSISNSTEEAKKSTKSIYNENLDSSDDEEKRYFELSRYSEGGREIKDILKKEEFEKKDRLITREVLQESKKSFDINSLSPSIAQSSNINTANKSRFHIDLSAVSTKVPEKSDVYSDPIFGLRIVKPLVSSTELKERMLGRTPVTVSKVKSHLATANLQEDWVIAGVVINKSPILKSQKGSQYCIWKISDLSFDMNIVSLFLFSGAYKNLWKTETGVVIGILNPNVLENKDDKDQATLSVDNAQKVMILGTSKDMGLCKSTTKSGKPCSSVVNRNRCEYCVYHVQKEYKQCSRRADLQSSANGRGLGQPSNFGKAFGQKKIQAAITQGQPQNFHGIPAKRNKKLFEKDQERLALLTGSKKFEKKESTEKIKNLPVETKSQVKKQMVELTSNQSKKDFERLSKLKNFSKNDKESKKPKDLEITFEIPIVASTPQKKEKNVQEINESPSSIPKKKDGFTLSKLQEINSEDSYLSKTPGFSRSKLQEWTMKQNFATPTDSSPFDLSRLSKSTKSTTSPKTSKPISKLNSLMTPKQSSPGLSDTKPTFSFPQLGSGITSGSIDLSESITNKQKASAKQNALKFVRENGKFKKSNPNHILESKEKKEQSLKRKREIDHEEEKKKKKLKETKNFSAKFKEMLETSSSHVNLIEKSEEEEKEKYFGKLEIKEKMEEKMMSTFKVPCKAVICPMCKYTAFSRSDLCKELAHSVKVIDAVKRFFKCGDCGNRTVTLDVVPTASCKKCNGSNWKRAAMMDEKKVKIPGTALSIRGGEEKFIGSDISNSNLNLLVPE
ncbi:protein MCM10 homolog [Leptopilina heterotoma]|uniref:protein MCM10 homolog n=1 Tax=Leptopilina heterotoma TaxID=63436 RepID=UPI001CA93102|nr:protein MCM10 homolog [Leptopilina heterotoma]